MSVIYYQDTVPKNSPVKGQWIEKQKIVQRMALLFSFMEVCCYCHYLSEGDDSII